TPPGSRPRTGLRRRRVLQGHVSPSIPSPDRLLRRFSRSPSSSFLRIAATAVWITAAAPAVTQKTPSGSRPRTGPPPLMCAAGTSKQRLRRGWSIAPSSECGGDKLRGAWEADWRHGPRWATLKCRSSSPHVCASSSASDTVAAMDGPRWFASPFLMDSCSHAPTG
uniref:Uncharacterized protein n=1 Tax=Triticum urartu TaxID=4572 RepID=A0A8R7U8J7_TRIUA